MKNVLRDKNVKIHVHAGGILNIFDGQTNTFPSLEIETFISTNYE